LNKRPILFNYLPSIPTCWSNRVLLWSECVPFFIRIVPFKP